MTNVQCTGNELRLTECGYDSAEHACDRIQEVHEIGVKCHSPDTSITSNNCNHGDVRLVDGANQFEGRVEICINNVWGTVCSDGWTVDCTSDRCRSSNADVVCRQMGFFSLTGYSDIKTGAFFGRGTGHIFIDDVHCDGTESSLLKCNLGVLGRHNCNHGDDVGVVCLDPDNTTVTTPGDETSDERNENVPTSPENFSEHVNTSTALSLHTPAGTKFTNTQGLTHSTSNHETVIGIVVGLVLLVMLVILAVIVMIMVLSRLRQRSLNGNNVMIQKTDLIRSDHGIAGEIPDKLLENSCIGEEFGFTQESSRCDSKLTAQTDDYSNSLGHYEVLPLTGLGNTTVIANADIMEREKGSPTLTVKPSATEQSELKENDTKSYSKPTTDLERLYDQLESIGCCSIIQRHQIKILAKLGSGQFGTVSKGVWQLPGGHSKDVTVKTLQEGATEVDKVKFLQEAAINGQFKHPNVAKLIGVVTLGDPVMVVLELRENGDLRSFLHRMSKSISEEVMKPDSQFQILLQLCIQIASGMKYLSGKNFVHRGVMARSVLVSADKHCKISNFGISSELDDYSDNHYVIQLRTDISVRWSAPEVLHDGKFSTASDVWSFGVVMFEIWSLGHEPFETFTDGQVLEKVDSGYRLPPPPGCPKKMYHIMIQCWNPDPSSRPTFSHLYDQFSKIDPHSQILAVNPTDENCKALHPQANLLGAPLEVGNDLYPILQSTYQVHDKEGANVALLA